MLLLDLPCTAQSAPSGAPESKQLYVILLGMKRCPLEQQGQVPTFFVLVDELAVAVEVELRISLHFLLIAQHWVLIVSTAYTKQWID
jgi:hypothetical protein